MRLAHCAELFLQSRLARPAQLVLVLEKAEANGADVGCGLPAELQFVVGARSLAGESCCRKQEGDGAQSEDQFHGGPPCLKLWTTNDLQTERVSQVSQIAPLFWQPH